MIRLPTSSIPVGSGPSFHTTSLVSNPFFEDYRYVIISGGNPASTGRVIGIQAKGLDYTKMSYEEIVRHFNIPE